MEPKYFLSLSVTNVRCFAGRQTLTLSDESGNPAMFTLITGENGIGKTTLLQCLAGFETVRPLNRNSEEHRWLYRFDLYEANGADFARQEHGVIEFTGTPGAELETNVAFRQFHVFPGGGHGYALGMRGPTCFGYGAGRRWTPPNQSTDKDADPSITLYSDETRLRSADAWLLDLDYSATKSSPIQARQKALFDRVKQGLLDVLPEIIDLRISEPTFNAPHPRVQFLSPYGWVESGALGHGYRSMIAWTVDLATRMVDRYPDSPNPLAEPAVCLVDEIDLHLHPKWQRQIIPHLLKLFPKTQFIVTAHSPLIVQSALDPAVAANVAVLRRDGDHVVIDNDADTIRAWTLDQIMTSPIYDLPARPASLDDKLARRKALLSKPALDDADHAELSKLDAEIGTLPTGESADDAKRLLKLTEDTQQLLKKYKGTGT